MLGVMNRTDASGSALANASPASAALSWRVNAPEMVHFYEKAQQPAARLCWLGWPVRSLEPQLPLDWDGTSIRTVA